MLESGHILPMSLNAEQRAAVRYLDGPLLVLAGAGSGKTRVITAKIAHLLQSGYQARQVAAITFTNKAAREMRDRVGKLVSGEAAQALTICTFHALGLKILRAEAGAAGLRAGFSILDPDDAEAIFAELLVTTERARIRAAQAQVSLWKNALLGPDEALAKAASEEQVLSARAYRSYEDTLRAYQAVDFDDLIRLPAELLLRHAGAQERWRSRLAYLLVDEYQDTNLTQYQLLRLLTQPLARFTVVGDDDQAIYAWRGASAENLARLTQDHPELKVIKLEQNYRSSLRILRSANALISHNPKVFEKALWSELGLGDRITVLASADDEAEAERIALALLAHKFEHRGRFGDYAILYRGNHQARVLETALRAHNVPYAISGGSSFFDRAEIKDLLAYLRLLLNPDDNPAFVRAVGVPKRGIGGQTLERLGALANERRLSLCAAIEEWDLPQRLGEKPAAALRAFAQFRLRLAARATGEPAGEVFEALLAGIGYQEHLFATADAGPAAARWKNVRDFADWLGEKGKTEGRGLLELAQTIALLNMLDDDGDAKGDAVRLSTLHAAKGLEFPQVFLAGVEEGILPHRESIASGQVEEERRLMYVGITRAQRTLWISHCRRRRRARELFDCQPSRFIDELEREDLSFAGDVLAPVDPAQAKAEGQAKLAALRALLARG
ncbi:ATP-dependent DNA helicase Rep [Burkholderiales bacterium]|nr:ATP-dependent DNA helicase Rep [Burkholderiales bacterium]